ncbi:hypothetical protein LG290_11975 [Halomonas sediminis]
MTTPTTSQSAASNPVTQAPEKAPSSSGKKPSAKWVIDQLVQAGRLFKDQYGRANYLPHGEGSIRPLVVQEGVFAQWLSACMYSMFETCLSKTLINEVIDTLVGLSQQVETQSVFVRTARDHDTVYIDMATAAGHVIKIDEHGWNVLMLSDVPVLFRCPPGMQPLPMPSQTGDFSILRQWWSLEDAEGIEMIITYLAYGLAGTSNFPILILQGAAGSGKTEAACLMRNLIDPSEVPTMPGFSNIRDNMITFLNSRLVIMDNTQPFKALESDRACRLTTGDGMRVRALYTNASEQLFRVCAPLIITAINSPLKFDDMADRSLTLHFNRIPSERRQTHTAIRKQFEENAPHLLAGLLDVVQTALRNQKQQTCEALPRMADFGAFGQAAAQALDLTPADFGALMQRLRGDAEGADGDIPPLVSALQDFMADKTSTWQGRATDLLHGLNATAAGQEQDQRDWPQNAKQLGHRLNSLASTLEHHGFHVERINSGGRRLTVRYMPEGATSSSLAGTDESESLTPMPPAPVITAARSHNAGIREFRRSLH